MSCPTCGETMQKIGTVLETDWPVWLCPRCGTLKHGHVDPITYVPALVERCRAFEKKLLGQWMPDRHDWASVGIAESINPPADRPQ